MVRAAVVLAVLSVAALAWPAPDGLRPRYTAAGELRLPAGVERWVAVGSSLGLGYSASERATGGETFHTVLLEPEAYASYQRSGGFPDGTMLALIIRSPAERVAPAQSGRVAGDLLAVELAVKDTARFAGGWAYFDFGRGRPGATARPFPRESCARCHAEHAARDNVFVQFYPLLRDR